MCVCSEYLLFFQDGQNSVVLNLTSCYGDSCLPLLIIDSQVCVTKFVNCGYVCLVARDQTIDPDKLKNNLPHYDEFIKRFLP